MSMIFGTFLRNRQRKINFTIKNEIVFSFSADMILCLAGMTILKRVNVSINFN